MAARAVVMSYVPCPNCGDPVGGRIPSPPGQLKLTCVHCKQGFEFEQGEVRSGPVSYDPEVDRWNVERYGS